MSDVSVEDAWEDATEYLVLEEYPLIVAAIRTLALVVHDDACVECHNTDMQARCPRRQRIEELGL